MPLQGNAAAQVLSVNSLRDFSAFHAQLEAAGPGSKQVVIMGAGLIGCEFASALAAAGYRVSLVDPGPRLLADLLPEAASTGLHQALETLGMGFFMGSTAQATTQAAAPAGGLEVLLSSGERLRADAVLSAIGLKADLRLARAAGLAVDRSIVVDAHLQTSAPSVYALGDCTQYAHCLTLPYVMPIMNAAKALAASLAGTPTALAFPLTPVAIKTPARPLVVAPPAPGTSGQWRQPEAGPWQWLDEAGQQRCFVLAGAQTAQRMAQSRLVTS